MKKYYIYDFDVIGKLTITEENDFITNIDFEGTYEENKNAILEESKLIRKAYSQLKEYFEGSRKRSVFKNCS